MVAEFDDWPFPVLKPEANWDEFDRDYLAFMRTAYAEGYRPRQERQGSAIEAGEQTRRSVFLVFRGRRNGWEPWLGDEGRSVRLGVHYDLPLGESACVCVRPPFSGAAHLALEWMRGRSLESLLREFEFVGGYPAGVVLRPRAITPPASPAGRGT